MQPTLKSLRSISALALIALLAACGPGDVKTPVGEPDGEVGVGTPGNGGNGGTGGTGGNGGTDGAGGVVVEDSGTVQVVVGDNTYVAGSLAKGAFDALNTARRNAGAGVLAQSAALDMAATAHALYLTSNIADGIGHEEIKGKVDFYEATQDLRIARAGFDAGATTEVIGGTGPSLKGADCVYGMLNTVYHGAALLNQLSNVGIGFGKDSVGVPLCVVNLANLATERYTQIPQSGSVIAYPYAGQTDVMETFYVGFETPRPPASLFPNTTAGTPVIVNLRNADFMNYQAAGTLDVVVKQFELKDAGGNLTPVGILAHPTIKGSDVQLSPDNILGLGVMTLVPLSPLTKGTKYTVIFSATLKNGDKPVTKTWSFTTKV